MYKAFKFRLYPTKEQKIFLSKQFGAVRYIYNFFLNRRKDEYLNNKAYFNYHDDAKFLTEFKKQDGYEWLNDINAQSLQATLRNLEVAYTSFFKKQTKFPRFHSKKNRQSIKIPQHFIVEDNKLYIPKLKTGIEINIHREMMGKVICCFISKSPTDKYYVSFLVETETDKLEQTDNVIGIDLGIKDIVVDSNGNKIQNENLHRKLENKLAYEQRQLSKKKQGSNNKNKQRRILAKVHEYIANSRKDFLHKLSKKLVNENQVIIAESLTVKKMMQEGISSLSKAIGNAGFGELLRQLEYKSNWYRRTFYQIENFFPSSKTCNNCQFVLDELALNIREWDCPNCKQHLDRDINAALNIKEKGLKDLSGYGTYSDIKQKLVEAPTSVGS